MPEGSGASSETSSSDNIVNGEADVENLDKWEENLADEVYIGI